MEQPAAAARAELDRWRQERPVGAALVWFPDRVRQDFGRAGFAGAVARLNSSRAESELPRFQRMYWAVEVPLPAQPGELGKALAAIADLPLADPHARVLLNVSTLARELTRLGAAVSRLPGMGGGDRARLISSHCSAVWRQPLRITARPRTGSALSNPCPRRAETRGPLPPQTPASPPA
jgi:hypothetical protein